MRYLLLGVCVFSTACAATSPTAPSASPNSPGSISFLSQSGGTAVAQARHGSELPFKGSLQASEAVDGAVHHLLGAGEGTHLGHFKYSAEITVDEQTGDGVGTVIWTAANGDQVFATTHGAIVLLDFPTLVLRETQVITGGTGRFSTASGTVIVDRSLDLESGHTTGSYSGTITLSD